MGNLFASLGASRERKQAGTLLDEKRWPELWALFAERATDLTDKAWRTLWTRFLEQVPEVGTPEQLRAIVAAITDGGEAVRVAFRVRDLIEQAGFTDEPADRAAAEIALEVVDRLQGSGGFLGEDLFQLRVLRAGLLGLIGRAGIERARGEHRALMDEQPEVSWVHYNFGLFCKRRGLFAEGLAANQRAYELGDHSEAVLWNLGICATGAGEHWTALKAWRELGISAELGTDGRVTMKALGMVQVRLTSGPMAGAGTSADDPQFEHVWIKRISPCHGRVLSPTFFDLSGEIGDLVLHDGAAIGFRQTDGKKVPRFPQLALLERGGARCFRLAGVQEHAGELRALEAKLPEGCQLYPHTEQMQFICPRCARGDGTHAHVMEEQTTHRRVYGKLVVPPGVALPEVVTALDAALKPVPHLRLACPSLHDANGDAERSRREAQLWDEIEAVVE